MIILKEKIIKLLKKTGTYKFFREQEYQPQLNDYENEYLTQEKYNSFFKKLLEGDSPCMISRFGSNELRVLKAYEQKKKYSAGLKNQIKMAAGVFPNNDITLDKFAQLYLKNITNIDLLGIWFNPFENIISKKYCKNAKITKLRNLEPYFSDNPWSYYLKDKKVLVIHPFVDSIKKQYAKKELLFKDSRVLPDFELIIYSPVQSIGGSNEYKSWFHALDKMKEDIAKLDFDIAIIGAGAYGLPLASHVKDIGKKAIHIGGATQMLFGVYGRRWVVHPNFKDIINKHWIKPNQNEKPDSAEKVENACYW